MEGEVRGESRQGDVGMSSQPEIWNGLIELVDVSRLLNSDSTDSLVLQERTLNGFVVAPNENIARTFRWH